MTAATLSSRTASRRARQLAPRYRGDIEGLRAVAVLLVVAFHAGIPFVPGGFVGVDVFFVLSGFLITGLLVDELRRSGTISLLGFYARRVRRLMPLSALVLLVTAAASFVLVPAVDRASVGGDIAGAAVGVANWHFALDSAQYMSDSAKSPVLHYWSLAVEEQFYLVWPLLLLLVIGRTGLALRRWDVAGRRIVVALGAIGIGSFAVSWWVGGDGTFAYYGLHTRAWELAAGAAVALARPHLGRLTRGPAVGMGYLGLALVAGSALVMNESTPFPGTAAAVPVVGTALLLVSGARMYLAAVPRLLRAAPLRFLGRVSYSWYLWHWPCLVLATARWGVPGGIGADGDPVSRLPAGLTVVVVGVSLLLAIASHYAVEQPVRVNGWLKVSRVRTLALGSGLVAACLVGVAAMELNGGGGTQTVATGVGLDLPDQPASAAGAAAGTTAKPQRPMTVSQARSDLPPDPNSCYTGYTLKVAPPAQTCRYGVPEGSRTIALIGDSHAAQWLPAFREAVTEKGWTLYYFAKSECAIADVAVYSSKSKGRYTSCDSWRHSVLQRLDAIPGLDAVYIGRWTTYQSHTLGPAGEKVSGAEQNSLWRAGMARSVRALPHVPRIVVLDDTPGPGFDVPSCLSKQSKSPQKCSFPRAGHTDLDAPLQAAETAASDRVSTLDLTGLVCPQRTCQVVTRSGVVVYRDSHHLTASFSRALGHSVAARLPASLA
jgi:peptidoglycan/LPS O-acetylase OafA/YrhL